MYEVLLIQIPLVDLFGSFLFRAAAFKTSTEIKVTEVRLRVKNLCENWGNTADKNKEKKSFSLLLRAFFLNRHREVSKQFKNLFKA